ncbi:MAG TPA: DUF1501 domain-containing protein [Pirellula sp.]|nr:DUF1501 domain-containing protein [Pirellula sp.]
MTHQDYRRRNFLSHLGSGVSGLALNSLFSQNSNQASSDVNAFSPPDGDPHFRPRAKSVIWIFLVGGMSHLESFDPKPELNKYAGKSISETPYKDAATNPLVRDNLREFVAGQHKVLPNIYPLQVGYRACGASGILMSDWFQHLPKVADELAIVRSMWTTDNDHGAQLQFHTGRHALEGQFPTIGSWIRYGLARLSDEVPQFIVLGTPLADCCGGMGGHGSNYLGPEFAGVPVSVDRNNPLPYASPGSSVYREEQIANFDLLRSLHRLKQEESVGDTRLRARIASYELAFRMQSSIPRLVDVEQETSNTHELYGINTAPTDTFGRQCLVARRLVETGTRFVQIYHGSTGGAGAWDAHSNLEKGHREQIAQIDKPIAGLIADLKQRGLLDETLVVLATEFGRTPGAEGANGRDHHPFGFSIVMAGSGIRKGVVHGATDELGFHAVEDRHYVTDVHATVMHLMGLEARRLEIPGRKRLEVDYGNPITAIMTGVSAGALL